MTTNFVDHQNAFLIDYLVPAHRLAIMLIRDHDKFPGGGVRPMVEVVARLLRQDDYAVMHCDFQEYISLSLEQRKEKFKKEYDALVDAQKEVIHNRTEQEWAAYEQNLKDRADSVDTNNLAFLTEIDKEIKEAREQEQQ